MFKGNSQETGHGQTHKTGKKSASQISDTALASRISEFWITQNKKTSCPEFPLGKGSEWILSREDLQMASKCIKRCCTHHYQGNASQNHSETPGQLQAEKQRSNWCWWGGGAAEALSHCWWEWKGRKAIVFVCRWHDPCTENPKKSSEKVRTNKLST